MSISAFSRSSRNLFFSACSLLIVLGFALPAKAHAFKPAAHWALASSVAEKLPVGNRIKTAMTNQPQCLAWGSIGPDLAGYLPTYLIERIGWFDAYHAQSVGAYCKRLLQVALESDDDRQIAFAAGWITHIAGDMAAHGVFVNPEAGVFLDQASDHKLHSELEGYADPVVWNDIAKLSAQDFSPYTESDTDDETTKLYARFVSGPKFGTLTVPTDGCLEKLVDRVNREVILGNGNEHFTYLETAGNTNLARYGDYFGAENMRLAEKLFAEVLAGKDDVPNARDPVLTEVVNKIRRAMMMYAPLAQSRNELSKTGKGFGENTPRLQSRTKRLRKAWDQANEFSLALLEGAVRDDFALFSNSWVAYAGLADGREIGSLRLVVTTGGGAKTVLDGGGTNHFVYFGMQWDDGTTREWNLETKGYDDFEAGARDVYYLHSYEALPIWRVKKIWIRLGLEKFGPDLPWWNLGSFTVYVNDQPIYQLSPGDHWTESGTTREAGLEKGDGLDPLLERGWPVKADAALEMDSKLSKF